MMRGHLAYYAVPGNTDAVKPSVPGDAALVQGAAARSQRTRLNWERVNRMAARWLPPARVNTLLERALDARTQGGAHR